MIEYRQGDVLKALKSGMIDAVAHGVNCSGGFGSGIAKQIMEEYPEVRASYIADFNMGAWELGRIAPVRVNNFQYIINCATQLRYGHKPELQPKGMYCSYEAIKMVMQKLAAIRLGTVIGMPMIGAGLANGDWNIIEQIINEEFKERKVFVYRL